MFNIYKDKELTRICSFISSILIFSSLIIVSEYSCKPSAIDVYRGNTSLKISYVDSIPIDSIVIYKNKNGE